VRAERLTLHRRARCVEGTCATSEQSGRSALSASPPGDQAGSTSPARYARGRQGSMQWLQEKGMARQGCAHIGVFGRQRAAG
jgi:hypothetical protein